MSPMTRWNPFRSTRLKLANSLDELFRNLVARPTWRDVEPTPEMRIEATESEGDFSVKAEVPGVERDDIDISVDANYVSGGAKT